MAYNTFWTIVLNMDNNFEDEEDTISSFPYMSIMLGRLGRDFIRTFTKPCIIMPYGFLGQVCKVYERYIYYTLKMNQHPDDSIEMRMMFRNLYVDKMLIVAVSIKIVYRIYDFPRCPKNSCLLQILKQHGEYFSSKNFRDMEQRILATYGTLQGIPIWHTAMKGEKMAYEVGLRKAEVKAVSCVVEICELYLSDLAELMFFKTKHFDHYYQDGPLYDVTLCNVPYIRNKHLAAAAVLATIEHLTLVIPDPTDILAQWTLCTTAYLQELSTRVVAVLKSKDMFSPNEIKDHAYNLLKETTKDETGE